MPNQKREETQGKGGGRSCSWLRSGSAQTKFFCSIHLLEGIVHQGKNRSFPCIFAGKDASFLCFLLLILDVDGGVGTFFWVLMIPLLVSDDTIAFFLFQCVFHDFPWF